MVVFDRWLHPACVTLLGLCALFFLQACGEEVVEKREIIRPVRSLVISEVAPQSEDRFPGRVQPAEKVDLSFQVAGALIEFPVIKGQQVKQGDLLARIDPRDYQSNLKASEARQKNALANLNRAKPLVPKQLISQADFERLEAEFDVATADLERSKKALNDTYLRASFDGVIADTFVQNFEDVQAKQSILSLQDNSSLEILVQVPEKKVLDAETDRDIVAIFEGVADREFPVTVKEFATEADPNTQTYEVTLAMENPEDVNLLPGMSATVIGRKKPSDSSPKVVYLPVSAVFADPADSAGQFVWIVADDSTVNRKPVTVSALENNRAVIEQGLISGQRVVTAGVHQLTEGQKVKILEDPS